MEPSEEIRQNERIASLEHAVFGVGDTGGGMIAEMRALREEFHGFREEVAGLYKMITIATFSLTGTIIGGVIVFLINTIGGQ